MKPETPKPGIPKPFEIGLVLAGAVSAGAYTAGVMDYLFEVLDAWYQAKTRGDDVPTHEVKIKVIAGASAGGMTTAIAAVELLRRANDPEGTRDPAYRSLPYQAWVEKIDITRLLGIRDISTSEPLQSLLDASVIEEIASEVIDVDAIPPWKPIPFLDRELKLYLTLGNLRGLPYEFKLRGETGLPYGMTDHADYQYIEIKPDTPRADWIKLRNAAIATGAFPVGLASRLIQRDTNEYRERIYKDGRAISGLLKLDSQVNEPYNFVAVDGGTLNNEPIELARSVWERFTQDDKERINSVETLEQVRQEVRNRTESNGYALIMVDPFPDQADMGKNATPADTALSNIVGPLVSALRAQSLFKIEELLRAGDQDADDRFLIAPIRYTETGKKAMNAIASGFLGGFGGFLAREFREHDYRLGRRNCQRFLQKYFVLEKEEAHGRGWTLHNDYLIKDPADQTPYYPIIPVVPDDRLRKPQGEDNPWPTYTPLHARKLLAGLSVRTRALMKKTLPFGWVDSPWAMGIIILTAFLVGVGEYVKAARSVDQVWLFDGLKNGYILIFQVILFSCFLMLVVLRIGKQLIERKLIKKVYAMLMERMREWGILNEKRS